jgi:hypothetical protein
MYRSGEVLFDTFDNQIPVLLFPVRVLRLRLPSTQPGVDVVLGLRDMGLRYGWCFQFRFQCGFLLLGIDCYEKNCKTPLLAGASLETSAFLFAAVSFAICFASFVVSAKSSFCLCSASVSVSGAVTVTFCFVSSPSS